MTQQIKPQNNGKKCGLINGIGTLIKWVFGNPDANDWQIINDYPEKI